MFVRKYSLSHHQAVTYPYNAHNGGLVKTFALYIRVIRIQGVLMGFSAVLLVPVMF
jgi:hypothetical protein